MVRRDEPSDLDIAGLGRFAEPALLILVSLAGGAKHGYAMLDDIAAFAAVRLGAGTLYGALARLEERGLVAALPTAARRRPYRLTPTGAAALRAHLAGVDAVAAVGRRRLAAT